MRDRLGHRSAMLIAAKEGAGARPAPIAFFQYVLTNGNAEHRGATSNDDGDRAPNSTGANSRSGI
jgi:hypothetical protein